MRPGVLGWMNKGDERVLVELDVEEVHDRGWKQ
jgi:hypothetical protein